MMTDILGIASLIVAAVAAGAAAWQARLLRFSLQVQSLLEVEKSFNEPEYRQRRHHAARQLLANAPEKEVDEVLDFLETLGLLVRRKALDAEMVYHTFFYWIDGYWRASADVRQRERRKYERVWEDLPRLYARALGFENKTGVQRQEPIQEFLEYEVEQYDVGA